LITDQTAAGAMRADFKLALSRLSPPDGPPSRAAARAVLAAITPR
jgi:hypothetical protein